MKKPLLTLTSFLITVLTCSLICSSAYSQITGPARRVQAGTSLPSKCQNNTTEVDIFIISSAGSSPGEYYCSSTNTWTGPFLSGTLAFANQSLSNLTNPTAINQKLLPGASGSTDIGSSTKLWASIWLSSLLQFGSNSLGYTNGTGFVFFDNTTARTSTFNVQSQTANRIFTLPNISGTMLVNPNVPATSTASVAGNPLNLIASSASAGTAGVSSAPGGDVDITAGNAANHTSGANTGGNINLTPGSGIGGGLAGIVGVTGNIGFNSGTAFASLGTPSNGQITYCSDCTVATPCAGSGTGALAVRLNSAWACGGGGSSYSMIVQAANKVTLKGTTTGTGVSMFNVTNLAGDVGDNFYDDGELRLNLANAAQSRIIEAAYQGSKVAEITYVGTITSFASGGNAAFGNFDGNYVVSGNGDSQSRHLLGSSIITPSVSSCGTSPSIAGTDTFGKVTIGTAPGTTCTVTFGVAFTTNNPACFANDETTSILTRAVPTLTTVVLKGVFVGGDVVSYGCGGF